MKLTAVFINKAVTEMDTDTADIIQVILNISEMNDPILHSNLPFATAVRNIPPGFGLLFLPLFQESGHHNFGMVALVEGPKVFGLQRHFVTFHGHAEREKQHFSSGNSTIPAHFCICTNETPPSVCLFLSGL